MKLLKFVRFRIYPFKNLYNINIKKYNRYILKKINYWIKLLLIFLMKDNWSYNNNNKNENWNIKEYNKTYLIKYNNKSIIMMSIN